MKHRIIPNIKDGPAYQVEKIISRKVGEFIKKASQKPYKIRLRDSESL